MKRTLLVAFMFCLAFCLQAQNHPFCSSAHSSDNCANACIVCDLDEYSEYTVLYLPGNPPHFCDTTDADQWIGFVAAYDSISISLQAFDCLNGDGLQAAIYQSCDEAPIVCNIGEAGGAATPLVLSTPLQSGQTYFLMVDTYSGDQCQFKISVSPSDASATPSLEAIEGPGAVAPGSSVVYSVPPLASAGTYIWTTTNNALINGQVSPLILPEASGYQVTVTFGAGNPEISDICVRVQKPCNENELSCRSILIGNGHLPPACPGTPPPASDECSDVCITCNFNGYSGNTAAYTPNTEPVPNFCGSIENDQWFAFLGRTGNVEITATPFNCANGDGIQLALMEECGGTPIDCYGGTQGSGNVPATIFVNDLIPGKTYFLMVDGFGGDQCDFTLEITPPSSVQPPDTVDIGDIEGPVQLCAGSRGNYSVPAVTGANAYLWSAPQGALINGYPSPAYIVGSGGNEAEIKFGAVGGKVCVTAVNSCYLNTDTSCIDVVVQAPVVIVLPPLILCNEDVPYQLPWSQIINASGTYEHILPSSVGCDTIIRQNVIVKPPILMVLGVRYLCEGECIVVCGEEYCDPGLHTHICTSYQGCDSTISFNIVRLNPVAEINSGAVLTCENSCVTLGSATSSGIKTWRNAGNQVIGTGNTVTVCDPGSYILTTVVSGGGKQCSASDTIIVGENIALPDVFASGGELSCTSPTIVLDGSSATAGAVFSWSGPDNFTSAEEDPVVNISGTYILTVSNPFNGCSDTAVAIVSNSGNLVLASANGGVLNCSSDSIFIGAVSNTQGVEYSWTGPDGFVSTEQYPVVINTGIYFVIVTNPADGCSASASAEVSGDYLPPMLEVSGDTANCTHPSGNFSISVISSAAQPAYSWTGPGGFSSVQQNPFVGSPGEYTITVTDLKNGCTSSATAVVEMDFTIPTVSTTGGTLTCENTMVTLDGSSSTPGVTFNWIGPNFPSSEEDVIVTQPGTYTLIVTALNGCTNTATALVTQDTASPQITLVQVTNDNGQNSGAIDITTNAVITIWSNQGTPFASTEDISGLSSGVYTITAIGANGCVTTLEISVESSVATQEQLSVKDWKIFPNPTSGALFADFSAWEGQEIQLKIYNSLGQFIQTNSMTASGQAQAIPVAELAAGLYTLEVSLDKGQKQVKRFVIQR